MFRRLFGRRPKLALHAVTVGGRSRSYLLAVPKRRSRSAAGLIVALHGGGGNPGGMARLTRLHDIAGRKGYLVAYPAGSNRRGGRRRMNWNAGGRYGGSWPERWGIDDVAFIRAVVESVRRAYDVDPQRIFATGISKGGMLAYRLACELAGTFAGIAVVAGTQTTDNCAPAAPVAILHIHGDRDENVPLAGGRGRWTGRFNAWPPVERGIAFWLANNRCDTSPQQLPGGEGYRYWRYAPAAGHADVDFCLMENCGHTWPGVRRRWWQRLLGIPGGPPVSASEMIVGFFDDHPKPASG